MFVNHHYYLSTWSQITQTRARIHSSRYWEEKIIDVMRKHGDFILTIHPVMTKLCHPLIKQLLRFHLYKISDVITPTFKIVSKETKISCTHQIASLVDFYWQNTRKVFLKVLLLLEDTTHELKHDKISHWIK